MQISRRCGHTEEIAGDISQEGIAYLQGMKCGICWRKQQAAKLPAMQAAEEMPGCSSFQSGTERKAADNREYFLLAMADDVRPQNWKAAPEQREAVTAAIQRVLQNTDPKWWQLQTNPLDTLRAAMQ